MRTEARGILTDALRDAHHWLDEVTTSHNQTIELLAAREGKTERWIRRTISLAFLCPALVKAAIDGRLPRGFGVKRHLDHLLAPPKKLGVRGHHKAMPYDQLPEFVKLLTRLRQHAAGAGSFLTPAPAPGVRACSTGPAQPSEAR